MCKRWARRVLSMIISIDWEECGVRILRVRVNFASYNRMPKDWNLEGIHDCRNTYWRNRFSLNKTVGAWTHLCRMKVVWDRLQNSPHDLLSVARSYIISASESDLKSLISVTVPRFPPFVLYNLQYLLRLNNLNLMRVSKVWKTYMFCCHWRVLKEVRSTETGSIWVWKTVTGAGYFLHGSNKIRDQNKAEI
jgi:hypothetical protein